MLAYERGKTYVLLYEKCSLQGRLNTIMTYKHHNLNLSFVFIQYQYITYRYMSENIIVGATLAGAP